MLNLIMVQNIRFNQKIVFLAVVFFFNFKVMAQSKVEELTYEDLVNKLGNRSKISNQTDYSEFEKVRIHLGAGYVSSFGQMSIDERLSQRYQNGMQLSLGVDLFSTAWFGETSFRNFGITNYGTEEIRLREFDLKLGFNTPIKTPIDFRIAGGLTTRYLKIVDPMKAIYIDETNPGVMVSTGLNFKLSPIMAFGMDVGSRWGIIGQRADRSSLDFTFELRAAL